ncbi:hypothetical protein L1049_001277 [Liquidambar formosana]|uniref:Spen paralogue and orthologue SPOC C-terminal domain-containing protein n=1 Tax=Liquidambar formosana TaxID=63359 RepID=A0AAP0R451_LIQFO
MENKIHPSPSRISGIDFLAESPRKRKSTAMEQQGTISESVYNYCFPRESKLQCDADSSFGIQIQGNTPGLFLNNAPQSIEPITFKHQFEKDQVQGHNDFTATWQTGNRNFLKTGVEKISNPSFNVPPQSFHHEGSLPLIKMSTGKTLAVSNWQNQEHHMFSQTEAHKSLPFLNSFNARTENAEVGPGLHNVRFGNMNHVITDNLPLEMSNPQSNSLRPLELLRQSVVKPDRFSVDLDGQECSQEASNSRISCESKQSGPSFNSAGSNDMSTVRTASLGASACTEHNENERSLQNEVHSGTAPLEGDEFKGNDQGHGDESIKIMKKTERSGTENSNYSLTEEASPKNGYSPVNIVVGHGQRNDRSHSSIKLDEKCKSLSGKVAPTFAGKLWDGSLQLSSSVTVSAVAFFKSGEKMPDVNWSESVEVKGKVRLEAFEKYIQDLPRSRNRGLMVISLCWKEGSPESGLAGMKEVANGYKKGERVGFAQLSPGIDLYICPRSDTIITILAKYGFFKGMAAVEDNQDSLIGCVVAEKPNIFKF